VRSCSTADVEFISAHILLLIPKSLTKTESLPTLKSSSDPIPRLTLESSARSSIIGLEIVDENCIIAELEVVDVIHVTADLEIGSDNQVISFLISPTSKHNYARLSPYLIHTQTKLNIDHNQPQTIYHTLIHILVNSSIS
jgi:hypothetical protein